MAGVGFGLALMGATRTPVALAAPGQRAELIAAIFTVNFLGLSIPVVIAGVATAHVGLHRTALAYCVAIAAHDLHEVACRCERVHRAPAPPGAGVAGTVTYGLGLQAWWVYLMAAHAAARS